MCRLRAKGLQNLLPKEDAGNLAGEHELTGLRRITRLGLS